MRVTLVGYGSTGDMLPLVALAVALRAAGHEVVTVGDEAGLALAERHGLEFHVLEGSLRETMQPGRPLALAIDAGHFTVRSFADYDAHDVARLSLIQQVAHGSDLLVGMPMAHYHAFIAAREVGARPVLGVLQPLAPTRAMAPAGAGMPRLPRGLRRPVGTAVQLAGWMNARGPINKARRALGQAPITMDPTRDVFSLCAWSPSLVPQPEDWPADRFAVTGRWHLPAPDWTPEPSLVEFLDADEPPVYVGFGSMQTFAGLPRLLDVLVAGLGARRILLAAEPDVISGEQLPGNVHRVTGHVPHEWLFPRCSVVVHHLRSRHRPPGRRRRQAIHTRPDLDGPTVLGRPPSPTRRRLRATQPAQAGPWSGAASHRYGRIQPCEGPRHPARRRTGAGRRHRDGGHIPRSPRVTDVLIQNCHHCPDT